MTDSPDPAADEGSTPRAVTRRREDTSVGCREMAADDRVRADATDTAHMRVRMESSADAWTSRADMLQRLERSHDARKAATAAAAAATDVSEDTKDSEGSPG